MNSEQNYLSKTSTNIIRALACICIVFCHMSWKEMPLTNPVMIFYRSGFLAVGIFFFYTGYNLMYSYNNGHFSAGLFIKRKFERVVLPFWIANILMLLFCMAIRDNIEYSFVAILKYILGIELLNVTLWYVVVVIAMYIAFVLVFGVFDFVKSKTGVKTGKLINFLLFLLVLFIYSIFIEYIIGEYIHEGTRTLLNQYPLTAVLGGLFASFNEKTSKHVKDNKVIYAAIAFALEIMCYCSQKDNISYFNVSPEIWKWIESGACALTANLLIYGVDVKNDILDIIAKYSYEIYILHLMCMMMYRQKIWVKSDVLYLILYLVTLAILSYTLKKVTDWIINKFHYRRKNMGSKA